jgi:hypothetical protein
MCSIGLDQGQTGCAKCPHAEVIKDQESCEFSLPSSHLVMTVTTLQLAASLEKNDEGINNLDSRPL